MREEQKKIVAVAEAGAKKKFEAQMALLQQFCAINCGTRNLEGNRKVVQLVDQVLHDMGAEVEHVEAKEFGMHIIARLKPEKPNGKVILNAHLDTAFFTDRVEDHPFRIEGEYAYGLGISDCKGGVVTILYGVKMMKEAGLLPDKEIVMIFNCDEEVGSPSSRPIFEREAAGAEAVLCFEPARNKNGILTSRRGLACGKIVVNGIAAHAGLDGGTGASAVRELANLIVRLTERSDLSVGMNYNVAPISGGANSSMVADHAEAEFCVPLDSIEIYERVKKDVLEELPQMGIVEGCSIETTLQLMHHPMERNEANVELFEKIHCAAELMGLAMPEESSFNCADCNIWAGYHLPVIDGMGPYMYEIHTTNEHMLIRTLPERTQLLGILLAML